MSLHSFTNTGGSPSPARQSGPEPFTGGCSIPESHYSTCQWQEISLYPPDVSVLSCKEAEGAPSGYGDGFRPRVETASGDRVGLYGKSPLDFAPASAYSSAPEIDSCYDPESTIDYSQLEYDPTTGRIEAPLDRFA